MTRLTVNGEGRELDVPAHETLLGVIRDRLGLTGTKLSCGHGECGACTVLLRAPGGSTRAVYSCLTLAVACHGHEVVTIEGLGRDGLHPLQAAFIDRDAVQCGYCTSGQILAAVALLEANPTPSDEDIRAGLSGNLCRCGTQPKIVAAVRDAARRMAPTP